MLRWLLKWLRPQCVRAARKPDFLVEETPELMRGQIEREIRRGFNAPTCRVCRGEGCPECKHSGYEDPNSQGRRKKNC